MAVWRVLILSAVTAYLVYAKAPTELPGDGVYRKLAGSPSEFPYFRPPSPEDASISSDVITHIVAEISDGDKHWEHVFTVDECQILTLTMIYHNPEIVLSAKDPTGKVVSPDFSVEEGFGINTGDMYPSRSIAFRSPRSGTWSVVLDWETSSTGWAYAYIIASVSGARSQLWATVENENLLVGSTVGLQAKMVVNPLGRDGDASITIKDYVKEADLMVSLPDGSKIYEPMTDSSDNVNDDMYKASFYASEAGVYNARIDFEGVHTDTGEAFSRSLFYLFQVVEPSIKLTDKPAIAQMRHHSVMDVDVIHIYVPVEWEQGQQTVFRGFTQIWGTADSGEVVPVAWLSGLMPIESSNQFNSSQHFLRFDLDGRWLELANAGLPLYIRNTNFDDIKAFVTLTSMDNIKVTTTDQELLRRKWKPRSPNDITFEMKNGYNPHLYLRRNSSEEPGKLILIHGYCAKETPFDLEEFTDYEIFEDFETNRLNDEFALLIKNYVEDEGISKFSLVSHSQGGFAALHLYTYYATGIDNTGDGWKLQSIGTPYHGSAVAGALADIGNIFGLLCGSNDDLTYGGAERWLSEIPPEKQQDVYYYTTQYGDGGLFGSYCIWGAGALLGHPNDGLVTISKTDLPHGNPQQHQHTVGECHSIDMKYPPQCKNKERNAEINSNAAR